MTASETMDLLCLYGNQIYSENSITILSNIPLLHPQLRHPAFWFVAVDAAVARIPVVAVDG